MAASASYAFSEDRMTDGTHDSTDGRGVDRTELFEGLVRTCARACVSMGEYEFLWEDLWAYYDDAGISSIFLAQLESFVLESDIHDVPPRITQRILSLRAEQGKVDLVERLIWHLGPECLDVDQVIGMCQRYGLYDALIYVYTRALKDYVAPVVELLGLMRRVRQLKKKPGEDDESVLEPLILNAYKVYPYLANVLSGLTYPSEEPLPEEEALQAKKDLYTFLFFGRSSVWPPHSGQLVLTADEDGAVEPTYPYARLLLRWDAESFLHCLDICFEDAYLNDYESQGGSISRHVIITILQEIVSSGTLSSTDVTFVNIFIARNVPKYHQYLDHVSPSVLHGILISLAEDPDQSTLDDRQLAAEYLLSTYNPHDSDHIMTIFREASFFRILRTRYRQDKKWASLLGTFLEDPSLRAPEMFLNINDVLVLARKANKKTLPADVLDTVARSLPRMLNVSVERTVALLEEHAPHLHDKALESLAEGYDSDQRSLQYLQYLLGPPRQEDDEYISTTPQRVGGPSQNVSSALRQQYISLQCALHPKEVIGVLEYIPLDMLDLGDVIDVCAANGIHDAVIWTMNTRGDPMQALEQAERFEQSLTLTLIEAFTGPQKGTLSMAEDAEKTVTALESIARIGVSICLERSTAPPTEGVKVPLEDIWFRLLCSQLNCVQTVSQSCSKEEDDQKTKELLVLERKIVTALRALVEKTFTSLVSITSTRAVSFSRLFKRLINSTAHAPTGTQYTEFRVILTGMLETYRSEGDILAITKKLVDRDLFDTIAEMTKDRGRGWGPRTNTCQKCRKSLLITGKSVPDSWNEIVVSRTGTIYHRTCMPS
jgi:vacuolar protein sorting-associated protein 8